MRTEKFSFETVYLTGKATLGGIYSVSLMLLPGSESNRQMRIIDKFYKGNKIGFGDPFLSVANPLIPSFFIDARGRFIPYARGGR